MPDTTMEHWGLGMSSKKTNCKINDIVQKGGGGVRKNSNFECIIKSDILLAEEGG